MVRGVWVFGLHAHLPEVRDPEVEAPWPLDWVFEAVRDAYVPLLTVFEGWARDGLDASVAWSVSPPLLSMLQDPDVQRAFVRRQEGSVRLAERLGHTELAQDWKARLRRFERWDGDLIQVFRRLSQAGVLELQTTAASHGILPLLASMDLRLAAAQIRIGLAEFRARIGHRPAGLWLPECAWSPELEPILAAEAVPVFFVEAHAASEAVFGTGAPMQCPSGPVAFPRDPKAALRVWSPDFGFPTRPAYRDFHSDGSDQVGEWLRVDCGLPPDRRPLGLKVWRVTDRTGGPKRPYVVADAHRQVDRDVRSFVDGAAADAEAFRAHTGRIPASSAPFDAELFGHWWYEGPRWLDRVVRAGLAAGFAVRGPAGVVRSGAPVEVRVPEPSSWGRGGFFQTWIGAENAWVQGLVEACSRRLLRWAKHADPDDPAASSRVEAILDLQASDWPFLMRGEPFREHAAEQVRRAATRFHRRMAGEVPARPPRFRCADLRAFVLPPSRTYSA